MYGIPILETKEKLRNTPLSEMHNMAMAINNHAGIHQEAYANEVLRRLQSAVRPGRTFDEIRNGMISQLADMRARLERNDVFWN